VRVYFLDLLIAGPAWPNIDEKHRVGKSNDVDLPTYDDAERHGSVAVNISGVHDNTHRKLKARHIQLIG
jgi:hypothetical protein